MSRKRYTGRRVPPGGDTTAETVVMVVDEDDRYARPLRHVVWHSPTGFAWGYGGSGPADLALSILCEHFGYRLLKPPETALNERDATAWQQASSLHQDFKGAFVANWQDTWEITSEQIDDWLARRQDRPRQVEALALVASLDAARLVLRDAERRARALGMEEIAVSKDRDCTVLIAEAHRVADQYQLWQLAPCPELGNKRSCSLECNTCGGRSQVDVIGLPR